MIGTKKLSTIREELSKALASAGEDPIRWLEEQIAAAQQKGGGTEVLEGLRRVLEPPSKGKRPKQRAGAKQ
jgi:hypothetical protein